MINSSSSPSSSQVIRVTVDLTADLHTDLTSLANTLDTSKSGALRSAIKVLKKLTDMEKDGGRLYVRDGRGGGSKDDDGNGEGSSREVLFL